jgi:hypothetical protein
VLVEIGSNRNKGGRTNLGLVNVGVAELLPVVVDVPGRELDEVILPCQKEGDVLGDGLGGVDCGDAEALVGG